MELERRVKTLEQEMKILKNQIQTTLREIQEQILIHYYPSLRSDSYTEEAKKETNPAESDQQVEDTGSFASKPKVKLVTLDDIRQRKSTTSPSSEANNHANGVQEKIGTDFAELAQWMGTSVMEIGPQKTGRMIEMKVEDGSLSPAAKDKLLQLLSMFGDGDTDQELIQEMIDAFLRLNNLSN